MKLFLAGASLTAVLCAFAVQPAKAEVIASGLRAGQCLDMKNGTEANLWACHGQGNQDFRFRSGNYGELLVGGRCLSTSGGSGSVIIATTCNGSRAQKWTITSSGALRNEEGWCADVERGGGQGSRVLAWSCGNGANQRWGFAKFMSAVQAASQGLINRSALSSLSNARPGLSFNANGAVAAGGANAVAAGGANVVSAGGANVVSAGGANVLVPVSGVVAAGGLN
jgi:hypothetical protein